MPARPPHRTRAGALALSALVIAAGALVAGDGPAGAQQATKTRAASASAQAFRLEDADGRRGLVAVRGSGREARRGAVVTASTSGGNGRAAAASSVEDVDIFDGLATAKAVRVRVVDDGRDFRVIGAVRSLRIAGRLVRSPESGRTYRLGRYGKIEVLRRRGNGVAGLRAVLDEEYRDFPAGATVTVAFASATASDATAAKARRSTPRPKPKPRARKRAGEKKRTAGRPAPRAKRREAPRLRALRTRRGFVFPVFGESQYSDDWGAPRAITITHQGNDIFAPTGAPVLAVTSGRLFRVGTREVPGNRVWLRSKQGDTFFYAHLSAFSEQARNGAEVEAGDVLGFVGSTGQAEKTPPHVHFEIHPDNGDPVNPHPFLRAWEGRRDVPPGAFLQRYADDPGARPGALVVVEDYLER